MMMIHVKNLIYDYPYTRPSFVMRSNDQQQKKAKFDDLIEFVQCPFPVKMRIDDCHFTNVLLNLLIKSKYFERKKVTK